MNLIIATMQNRKLRWLFLTITLVIVVGLAIFSWFDFGIIDIAGSHPVYLSGWRSVPFDKTIWDDANEYSGQSIGPARDNRRALMINDLLTNHLHKGMTKSQVESILGHSQAEGEGDAYYNLLAFPSADQEFVMWLKCRSSQPSLRLSYQNKNGIERLKSAKIVGK